jgi:hypothetical protein
VSWRWTRHRRRGLWMEEDDIETLVGTDLVKLTTKVAVWRLAGSASSIRDELPELLRLFPPTVFHKYDVEPDC